MNLVSQCDNIPFPHTDPRWNTVKRGKIFLTRHRRKQITRSLFLQHPSKGHTLIGQARSKSKLQKLQPCMGNRKLASWWLADPWNKVPYNCSKYGKNNRGRPTSHSASRWWQTSQQLFKSNKLQHRSRRRQMYILMHTRLPERPRAVCKH